MLSAFAVVAMGDDDDVDDDAPTEPGKTPGDSDDGRDYSH